MNAVKEQEIRYCQTCLEKGETTLATREWQVGIYNCDSCFTEKINNLTSISPTEVIKATSIKIPDEKPSDFNSGPILDRLYQEFEVPKELQFDSVDEVCRNYEKLFNFYAPAIVNRSLDSLSLEIEQLGIALFNIKYRIEPLTLQINKLKEKRRIEKGLKNFDDSKEEFAKGTKSQTKTTKVEKLAKNAGVSGSLMEEMIKKAREREFNIMAGNCPDCGGAIPCSVHTKS